MDTGMVLRQLERERNGLIVRRNELLAEPSYTAVTMLAKGQEILHMNGMIEGINKAIDIIEAIENAGRDLNSIAVRVCNAELATESPSLIRAIKEYRMACEEEAGYRPGLREAKDMCEKHFPHRNSRPRPTLQGW